MAHSATALGLRDSLESAARALAPPGVRGKFGGHVRAAVSQMMPDCPYPKPEQPHCLKLKIEVEKLKIEIEKLKS